MPTSSALHTIPAQPMQPVLEVLVSKENITVGKEVKNKGTTEIFKETFVEMMDN